METKFFKYLMLIFSFISSYSYAQVSEQWIKIYNGSANSNDYGNSVCITPSMNIAVTGFSVETAFRDVYTALYSQSGNLLWEAHYNGGADNEDYGTYVTSDLHNNIIVAGSSIYSEPGYGALLIKYNSNGVRQWVVRDDVPSQYRFGTVAKADSSGNIYFGEKFGTLAWGSGKFSKYSPRGKLIWEVETGRIYNILIANDGSVYSSGTINFKYLLNKYTPEGILMYSDTLGFGPGQGNDRPLYIACDVDDNIYCTGSGPVSALETTFIVKINPAGQVVWQRTFKFGNDSYDGSRAILVDSNGNVYIGGNTRKFQTPESSDFFIVKYSSSGDSIWTAYYDSPASNYDFLSTIAFERDNSIIAAGTSIRNINTLTHDFVTVKFDRAGSIIWIMNYNGTADTTDILSDMAVSRRGDIIVTGGARSIGTGSDITTIKYKSLTALTKISNDIPQTFRLYQNYPNPFNPVTNIGFSIPKDGSVKLTLFDALGKEIFRYNYGVLKAGEYNVKIDGTNLPSGIYFYKITAGNFTEAKKMILCK